MKIPRLVIAGTHSGVGKTSTSTGIMGALTRHGKRVQAFKLGPDFLDGTFHSTVTKRPSRNLDSWMMPRTKIPSLFTSGCVDADVAIIEGAMGLFDGIDGASEVASTSELAKILKAPVILVIDAWGLAGSTAAVALGYKSLDPELRLEGVILNRVAGETHTQMCKDAIMRHSKIPVLGAIPMDKAIMLPERYLGLIPASKTSDPTILEKIVDHVGSHVNLDQIMELAEKAEELDVKPLPQPRGEPNTVIGVARDNAFSFYYQENLDRLRMAGARLEFFSPLEDRNVPASVNGLYIGGGYPEVFSSRLSQNHTMLESIVKNAEDEMPIYAECGGIVYLTKSIEDLNGAKHGMVGLLEAETRMEKKLVLSYTLAETVQSNLITNIGDLVKCQEYHFSSIRDVPMDARFAFVLKRGIGLGNACDGWTSHNVLASYMHTNFASDEHMATRFVDASTAYTRK